MPEKIKRSAEKVLKLFVTNPFHPSFYVKKTRRGSLLKEILEIFSGKRVITIVKGGYAAMKIRIYRYRDGKPEMVAECLIRILDLKYFMFEVKEEKRIRDEVRKIQIRPRAAKPKEGVFVKTEAFVKHPKIVNCSIDDDVREIIEAILKSEFQDGGSRKILERYGCPVRGPTVEFNDVGYAWTVEESL